MSRPKRKAEKFTLSLAGGTEGFNQERNRIKLVLEPYGDQTSMGHAKRAEETKRKKKKEKERKRKRRRRGGDAIFFPINIDGIFVFPFP